MPANQATCTVAVDMMGGDRGSGEFVRALAALMADDSASARFLLVGKERLIERLLRARRLHENPRLGIVDASEVIGMDEKPIQALKRKKNSSMARAIDLLTDGSVDAMVSCGNTGALMAGGTLRVRPLAGIERPALASIVPTRQAPVVLLDVGANPEATPDHLVHNAVLGANYARAALDRQNPTVGLLTIGTEEGKGTTLTNKTHNYLKSMNGLLDYRGPIEGFQVFDGAIDVVVCDGFVGNIVLKASEGLYRFIGDTLREELTRGKRRKLGAALTRPAFRDMKSRLNPNRYSGAPLLGLRGNILKAHGSADHEAIAGALRVATEIVAHDMIDAISADVSRANDLMNVARVEAADA